MALVSGLLELEDFAQVQEIYHLTLYFNVQFTGEDSAATNLSAKIYLPTLKIF